MEGNFYLHRQASSLSHLLSSTVLFLLSDIVHLPSSPLPFPIPFLHSSAHALSAPFRLFGTGSLSAPLRLFGTDPLRPLAPSFILAPFNQTGPNGGPPFGPVWQNGAERMGMLGAGVGKLERRAGREHVPRSGGRVLGKRKKMEGRGAMPGRGKGMVPERRCIGRQGVWREKRRIV